MMKKIALAASLALVAFGASAMTNVADEELSAVSGQDGVSIFADVKINIGDFSWSNTDAQGASHSINFGNIAVSGAFAMGIDVVSGATVLADAATLGITQVDPAFLGKSMATYAAAAAAGATTLPAITDAIQISFPANNGSGLNIAVGNITMGNGGSSMGSMAITGLQLGGTKVWIWGH